MGDGPVVLEFEISKLRIFGVGVVAQHVSPCL